MSDPNESNESNRSRSEDGSINPCPSGRPDCKGILYGESSEMSPDEIRDLAKGYVAYAEIPSTVPEVLPGLMTLAVPKDDPTIIVVNVDAVQPEDVDLNDKESGKTARRGRASMAIRRDDFTEVARRFLLQQAPDRLLKEIARIESQRQNSPKGEPEGGSMPETQTMREIREALEAALGERDGQGRG